MPTHLHHRCQAKICKNFPQIPHSPLHCCCWFASQILAFHIFPLLEHAQKPPSPNFYRGFLIHSLVHSFCVLAFFIGITRNTHKNWAQMENGSKKRNSIENSAMNLWKFNSYAIWWLVDCLYSNREQIHMRERKKLRQTILHIIDCLYVFFPNDYRNIYRHELCAHMPDREKRQTVYYLFVCAPVETICSDDFQWRFLYVFDNNKLHNFEWFDRLLHSFERATK